MTESSPTAEPRDVYLSMHRNAYGKGGALAFGNGLNAALRARGATTLFLNQTARAAPEFEEYEDTPVRNIRVPQSSLLWRLKSWLLSRRLEKALRELPPPRRAFVSMSMYWAAAARRAWPNTRVIYPVPCLLANCLPFTWPKRRPPSFWKWLDFHGVRRAEHAACAAADSILAPTHQAREEILAFHPGVEDKIEVCPYGPPPVPFYENARLVLRVALGMNEKDVLFLAIGAYERNKGFDWLIQEWPRVNPHGILAIVGEGPDREAYEQMIQDLQLSQRVFVAGLQPKIEPWLSATDCMLSASRYDMFPYSIQEGWAAGRPALVPRHAPPHTYAGCAEVVSTEGGGLVYDRERADDLVEQINQFITDADLRTNLTAQAKRIGRARAGWEEYVRVILQDPSESARRTNHDAAAAIDPTEIAATGKR